MSTTCCASPLGSHKEGNSYMDSDGFADLFQGFADGEGLSTDPDRPGCFEAPVEVWTSPHRAWRASWRSSRLRSHGGSDRGAGNPDRPGADGWRELAREVCDRSIAADSAGRDAKAEGNPFGLELKWMLAHQPQCYRCVSCTSHKTVNITESACEAGCQNLVDISVFSWFRMVWWRLMHFYGGLGALWRSGNPVQPGIIMKSKASAHGFSWHRLS